MGRVSDRAVLVFAVLAMIQIVGSCSAFHRKVHREIMPCEDGWTAYKDEKCIKIISDKFVPYSRANAYCESVDSIESPASLLSIKNEQEQKTVHNFIFNTNNIRHNIWLGLRYANGFYTWPDGTSVEFANWMDAEWINATLESDNKFKCVEMNEQGKWSVVSCTTNNTFVCERQQTWSLRKIQKSFLQLKNEQLNNPVPIGFIYVQLSNQHAPGVLWPAVKWVDITSKYAGLFFRAEGSGSKKFDDGEQEENIPRIISVEPMSVIERRRIAPLYGRSRVTLTEKNQQFPWRVNVVYSEGEVRPRNEAIRIWRRKS